MKDAISLGSLNLSGKQRITTVFVVILCLFFFLFYLYNNTTRKFDDSFKSVEQTYRALFKARELVSSVIDMNANSKEYLVTGEKKYLLHYNTNRNNLSLQLVQLKELTADTPQEAARLDSLSDLVKNLVILSDKQLRNPEQNARLTEEKTAFLEKGKVELNLLKAMVLRLQESKSRLLSIRERKIANSEAATQRLTIIFEYYTFAILIAVLVLLLRNTDRRNKIEAEIKKSTRFFEFTTRVNDLVLRETNVDTIYAEVCKIAHEVGGFIFVWIGEPDRQSKLIHPIKWAGSEDGFAYITNSKISIENTPNGQGPSGRAIREGKYYYCNDIANDPIMVLWRDSALKRGYRSSIALPIVIDKTAISLITLYASEPNFFSKEEVRMLVRISQNISFALENIQNSNKRKLVEFQLHKVSQAVEQSTSSILITDLEGKIEYANPAFSKTTGYSFEEVLGQNPRILKTGYTSDQEYNNLWQNISTGISWQGEFYNRKKNGEPYWEYAIISPVRNTEGVITNYVAVKENITERKKIQLALDEQSRLVNRILELATDIISVINKSGNRVLFSNSIEKVLGYTKNELMGKSVIDVVYEEDKTATTELFTNLIQGKGSGIFHNRYVAKDGSIKYVSWSIIWDPETGYFYSIGRDITDERQQLIEREKERIEIENKIKKAVFEGEEKQKRQMSMELHDNIVQVLGAVQIYLDMYAKNHNETVLEKAKNYLNESVLEIRNLSHVIAAPPIFERGWIPCIEMLLHQLKVNSSVTPFFNYSLQDLNIPEDLKVNIYRILQEQINNIIKHSKATGVTVALEQSVNHLSFEIADNGIGFDTAKITDGIGLTNIRTRVAMFDGEIYIQSAPNHGCRMVMEFKV